MRWRMVSSRLTAGGLAGYFSAGTTYRLNNIPPATYSDRTRAETLPTRPYATANTTANSAPIATLNAITPKPMPMLACTPRVNTSAPCSWPPWHGLVGRADTILIADRPIDDGFDEDPGKDERDHSSKGAGEQGHAR